MNTFKPKKPKVLFNTLILNSFTFLIVCLLCSYPLWFPTMKHLLYVYIPHVFSMFINPKCLFIVGNIIIVILVRESKVSAGSTAFSLDTEIYSYEKHGESAQSNGSTRHSIPVGVEELEKLKIILIEDREINRKVDDQENDDQCQGEKENYVIEQEGVDDQVEEDGEDGLPHEELTKRVEDFIARVNRQRWLEANLVACSDS